MPRARVSQATQVLRYFQTAPIDEAKVVLDLVRDVVRHREELKPRRAKTVEEEVFEAVQRTGEMAARPPKRAHRKKPAAGSEAAHAAAVGERLPPLPFGG